MGSEKKVELMLMVVMTGTCERDVLREFPKKDRVSFLNEIIAGDESTDDETEVPILQPAPYIIVVHGPPKVGKSLLIKSLVKYYTKHDVADITGPITIVAGFVECPNNVNGMIGAAKYADAVIFVIDVSFGYEMETLEFVNLLKVHGMPTVMGVFTHLDCFKNKKDNDEIRTAHFKKDFRNEIYEGAQIFCVSAPVDKTFISGMEFHPLSSRAAHPYVLVDRFEDVTSRLRLDQNCNRDIIFYGYLRGCDIKNGTKVHIAGIHDFPLADVTSVGETPPVLGETPPVRDVDDADNINKDGVLPQETRFKKDTFRMGSYLMLKVFSVPSEMVNYHDPCRPILIGGISPEENFNGSISERFERHGLHTKSLKARDPIIVSVGWRRYQTSPLYAQEDFRKILEFIPEDKPCSATFWGPFATNGTRVVAVQSLADNKAAFRILATGEVIGFSRAPCLSVKTLVGTPCKIISKTAFIKDMFTSDFEVKEYKDVTVKTESGILGKVNEAGTKEFLSTLKWKFGQEEEDRWLIKRPKLLFVVKE
ncbi:ribosome biogenesis protein bms1-like [Papaver somniferum]|uniref:ribosome biogenesis protein bms1-like n=1 Tax=Papaver somniferum TaxID=3469 RepID=UPI000E6FC615|nr:ribosome biogenesis protein bms1-like [Papaver somniferum]